MAGERSKLCVTVYSPSESSAAGRAKAPSDHAFAPGAV